MIDNTGIKGIKVSDPETGKFKKYLSPHSELGMVTHIQDIGRWNGSGYDRVLQWLKEGKPVYCTFNRYDAVL